MACVFNLFVLSLTFLATLTGGSRQYDALDKKINAIKDMLEVEIGMIKQDLEMVVKNLSMSVAGEVQGKTWDLNTLQIANTLVENMKHSIQAAEDFYTVIHRGFISEKMAMRKSFSRIEQSVAYVQRQLEHFNGDFTSKFQLLNAEINKNKNDIEAKVEKAKQDAILKSNEEINRNKNDFESKIEKAKHDAILKSNEDSKTSNITFNGELNSLQKNFMKIVNDVKKDVADINGRVINKSETLEKFQLLNTEINRNKNDIEAKVEKAKQDAILKAKGDFKVSIITASFVCHQYGNSIYFKLDYMSKMDFLDGSKRCKQYGAHLPEVTTSGESAFLVNTFGSETIFLGATDLRNEGYWVWENTGQAVKYGFTDWAAGEPNNAGGRENCLGIYRSKWNDGTCNERLSIVCELDI